MAQNYPSGWTYRFDSGEKKEHPSELDLFFINLGGYKVGEFEEYHYKMVTVAETLGLASKKARATTFINTADLKVLFRILMINSE